MPAELVVFYNKLIANLKSLEAKRSFKERTIFDWHGKRLRRKLEKGYLKGVQDGVSMVRKTYKKIIKELEKNVCQEN